MNLPNKLTIGRIIMSIMIIIILLGGDYILDFFGTSFPHLFVNETLVVDTKYVIAGVLFIIASITDFIDGHVARKYNMVTDFGKMIDAISDKILTNTLIVVLACDNMVHPIIAVIINL